MKRKADADMDDRKRLRSVLESMMFVWGDPLSADTASEVTGADEEMVLSCFRELQEEYRSEDRGLRITETDGSFRLVTAEENLEYLRKLFTPVRKQKLSRSALEVLALIAYNQPVTKGYIESVRGVRCDRVIEGLMGKDLIRKAGRSSEVGRPVLYVTTEKFLTQFGLKDIGDLPAIEDMIIEDEEVL